MTKRYAVIIEASVLEALASARIVREDGAIVTVDARPRDAWIGVHRLEIPGVASFLDVALTLHVERPRRRALIRRLLSPWWTR